MAVAVASHAVEVVVKKRKEGKKRKKERKKERKGCEACILSERWTDRQDAAIALVLLQFVPLVLIHSSSAKRAS